MIQSEKADVYVVKGADNEFQAVNKVLEGKNYSVDSVENKKLFVYSAKTDCKKYQWVFYVEKFFGEYKITQIFERV